jgi:hypothetical protein
MMTASSIHFSEKREKHYMRKWLTRLFFLFVGVAVSSNAFPQEDAYVYRLKEGYPKSDLAWGDKWKDLDVVQTSPTSFQIHWTKYHGSTGELIKDHVFDAQVQGLCSNELQPGQKFTVSLSGEARILKKHGHNPAAYFKLAWNRGLELLDVQPRIPEKRLKDSAHIGPSLDKPTDSREMTFRVRDNQTQVRLSLVYGGHGELMRYQWTP